MTAIKFGEALSYTLPLQSIDLTYLSKYVQNSRDEKIPLWSKKCLDGESEYYQIKIVAQDVNGDDCYSESSDTYKCHVCNLDVPKTCFKEHNESKIHETYKNIFSKVLERASKHFELCVTTNDGDINKDSYYCITCSKIVKKQNKYHHEASSYHIKSQEKINILSNFYELFKDDEKEIITELNKENENNDVGENDRALKSNKENLKNDIANNNSRGIREGTSRNCNKMLDSDDDISMTSEPNDEMNSKTNLKPERIEKETSHDELNSKTNLKPENIEKETSLEEKLTKIIAKYKYNVDLVPVLDGEFIIISTPHGKGRIPHENFHSYRQLKNSTYCQMCRMWISQDTKAHEATEIHLINILKPVNDKFGRMIDTISSHCVVCNEVVLTLSDHHTKDDHNRILLDKKIENNSQNNGIVKNGKTSCEICNIFIDTHNFPVHLASKKHKQNIQMNVYKQNMIAKIDTNKYHCSICNLSLTENTVNDHINERSHINKKISGMQNGNTSVKNTIAKNKSIASTNSNNVANVSNKQTNNNVDNKLDDYYKLFVYTDDTKTKIKCIICNVNVPHNDRNVKEHIEGKSHIDISNNQKMGDYHKLLVFTDDAKTQVKCRICDVNIPFVKKNIAEHMGGKRHEDKENLLLEVHKITKSTSQYHCKCCEADLTKFNFLDHINSKTHTDTLQEKYIINKVLMRKAVYENDTNDGVAPSLRGLYKNLLICNKVTKVDDAKFYCKICDIHLTRMSEIDHMLGEKHMSESRKERINNLVEAICKRILYGDEDVSE